MKELVGLIVFGLIYGVFSFLSYLAKQAEQKQKQEAAERQRKQMAARQQEDATGRAAPKKKFRQIEQIRGVTDDLFVAAESILPPPLRRESMFDAPIDAAGQPLVTAPMAQSSSDYPNPIAQGIMAMMTTPQSMQQAVILSEIFNRPKFEQT